MPLTFALGEAFQFDWSEEGLLIGGLFRRGRTVNARFAVICAHYLFDPDFCNVASGWEKGIDEKNVQERRRSIWLDDQNCMFHAFEELNAGSANAVVRSGASCCIRSTTD